jgi:RNA polymerase sigma-70 factor (ECF subfamily)
MNVPDFRQDAELIDAVNSGDGKAFEVLYFRYRDWVVRLAQRFTGNDEDSLDVLQETFAYLHRKFPGFVLTARMTTFLYPVVRNLSIAARRKRRRFISDDAALELFQAAPPQDMGSELPRVLAMLPTTHREVLLMRFVDGMSLNEIAQALDISVGTVKSRLHNGLQKLREDPTTRAFFE